MRHAIVTADWADNRLLLHNTSDLKVEVTLFKEDEDWTFQLYPNEETEFMRSQFHYWPLHIQTLTYKTLREHDIIAIRLGETYNKTKYFIQEMER